MKGVKGVLVSVTFAKVGEAILIHGYITVKFKM
jgi:hypothetical protein